jgi:hypothetical protein
MPIGFGSLLPGLPTGQITRLGGLRGIIRKAYDVGATVNRLYNTLTDAGIGVERERFTGYASRLYDHFKATDDEISHWLDTGRFRISELRQQKLNTEGRFWTTARYNVKTPAGGWKSHYMIYSFDDYKSPDELENEIRSYIEENYGIASEDVTSVKYVDLYKNY